MRVSLSVCALALGACNQNPIETPVRSFDRPSDAALTCTLYNPTAAGYDKTLGWLGLWEPRPLTACATLPSDQQDSYKNPDDSTGLQPYVPELRAIVANSARGEVGLVNVPRAVLVDLDYKNPGFNFIPVGRLPESLRATSDGCMAVTANVDSCDLAVVDLTTMYNMPFVPQRPGQSRAYANDVVRRIQLWAGGQRIEARPTALEVLPHTTHAVRPRLDFNDPSTLDLEVIGAECIVRNYTAWIALPGCQAVVQAEISLRGDTDPVRADITQAITVTRDGATLLADPSALRCPAECTAGMAPTDPSDPLAVGAGGRLPASEAAPGTLALDEETGTRRLVIGDLYGERMYVVPLDSVHGSAGVPRALELETGALGVLRARVSPRTPAGKFLYAVARDGTVRVVDLDREVECETNPDPSAFTGLAPATIGADARHHGCLPLGDRSTPARSANAISPGITLPNGALARDVAFVHLDTPEPPATGAPLSAQPGLLVGDFAWVAGSDGRATVVNIYDACPQPNDPQLEADGVTYTPACAQNPNADASRLASYQSNYGAPYPVELDALSHRIRNGERRFLQPNNIGDSAGTPRISDPLNPVTVTVKGSPAKVGQGFRTPTLEVVPRRIESLANDAQKAIGVGTLLEVPDPTAVHAETWTLAWEGVVPGTVRAYGTMCGVGNDDCPRGAMIDAGAALCARGVQADDKLELTGCTADSDCVYSQVCAHDPSAPADVINGLCLDRSDPSSGDPSSDQLRTCSPLLRAWRRYRVTSARQGATLPSGRATDVMSLSEIYEPEFLAETHACIVDADCADVTIAAPDSDIVVRAPLSTRCLRDSDGSARCLRACDPSKIDDTGLCGKGYLCAETNTSTVKARDYRCMRAPLDVGLITACLTHEQRYQVRVGGGFSVTGSSSGFMSDLEPDATTRECLPPPISSEYGRLRNPRIQLDAPLCPQQIDAGIGVDAISWIGAGGPNMCQMVTPDRDKLLHFENNAMAFALRMPSNPTGYIPEDETVVSFSVVGGGFPLGLALGVSGQQTAQSPKSMVVAPDRQTVFVVDEGKGTASSALRGQLLRLVSAVQACDPSFQVR